MHEKTLRSGTAPLSLVSSLLLALGAGTALAVGGAAGCEEQGPAERAGERIDEATEDAAENVDETIDDAQENLDDARDDLNDNVDDTLDNDGIDDPIDGN